MNRLHLFVIALTLAACAGATPPGPAPIRAHELPAEPCKNHYILGEPGDCLWMMGDELKAARSRHTATLLPDGRLLVAGGSDDPGMGAEIYDPRTGRWTVTGALNANRSGHTATLLADGTVLVLGGDAIGSNPNGLVLDGSSEVFDPANETWTYTSSMITVRAGFSATLLPNGKVLVVGGVDERDETLVSAELYDPRTGSWERTGSMSQARADHTATLLPDGRVLVTGGVADDFFGLPVQSAEVYDPSTGTWAHAGSLKHARVGHTATALADGTVLVSGGWYRFCPGGYCDFGTLTAVERFDPDPMAARSTVIGEGPPRYYHTATRLPDASILTVGGLQSYDEVPNVHYATLRGAQQFAPDGATWRDASILNLPRFNHTATLLPDGSVLVVGGSVLHGYTQTPLKSVEIYRGAVARNSGPR
jgi:Kelch motif protein